MLLKLENLLLEVSKSDRIDLGDMREAEELILQSLLKGLSVKRAGIWMRDEKLDGIRCSLLIDLHQQARYEDLLLTRSQYPRYFAALDEERCISAEDALTHSATAEFAEGYLAPLGIASMLDMPIRHRGRMVGIVCCEHIGQPKHWSEDEMSFAAAMADLVGRAISAKERNDYARQLELTNQSLESLVEQRTASLEKTLVSLKQAQQQLVENEKMASLGSLVAGVAHEVNTPLGVAVTAASHCQLQLQELHRQVEDNKLTRSSLDNKLSSMDESLHLINQNLARAAELIQNFKKTAVDQHNLALTEFELGEYVRVVMSSLMPILKTKHISFELLNPLNIRMYSYPGALAQVLTNLVNNASQHAFHNGTNNVIQIQLLPRGDKEVELCFGDNGKGMPADIQKKVFEPFFTTKRGQGGSGLGLSICYNLVTAKLKGQMAVESTLGKGTLFRLILPLRVD
ncbi:sensor histidine kinase [Bowmanella pacifica]|uniref:histidine kinase n=2 Tax=Bowmanella TaxID=366580 RepID=A0A917YX46_9ALTE|nr:GAF domain-containing sensor histidine kinase [Bowmanella pacifica]GGO68683.1 diguanylate cyclase [Bowmanella pacifica]